MVTLARKLLDLEDALAEAERKLASSQRLWQREWAATTLRALRRELSAIDAPATVELAARANTMEERLRRLDQAEFQPLRDELRDRGMSPERFGEVLASVPSYEWDAFTERLLDIHEVPAATKTRTLEMIKYQATPASSVFELVSLLGPEDVLFDLGSGLGKVPLLAALLSPARTVGVELDPAYGDVAAKRATELGLKRAQFTVSDAREADYGEGTVFYFFFPFDGEVMSAVLAKIRADTKGRSIRIASLHKSTLRFDEEKWLVRESTFPSGLALFRSAS